MKFIYSLLFVTIMASCNSKQELPEFVTDDPEKVEEFADKAINEAQILLDSLEQTPVLNTDI